MKSSLFESQRAFSVLAFQLHMGFPVFLHLYMGFPVSHTYDSESVARQQHDVHIFDETLTKLALGFFAGRASNVMEMTPQRGDLSSTAHIFRVPTKTAAAHAPEERADVHALREVEEAPTHAHEGKAYDHAHEDDRNAVVLSANVSAARAAISTGPTRRALRWLHIQKCGQSFASTVFLFGCPQDIARQALRFLSTTKDTKKVLHADQSWLNDCIASHATFGIILRPMGGHSPHVGSPQDASHLAVMLREPEQRLLSHFEYFVAESHPAAHGPVRLLFPGRMPNATRGMPAQLSKYHDWIRNQANWHCQTKMLTGLACNSPVQVMPSRVNQALQVVQRAAFVGLLEEWPTGVALFHCKFMGGVGILAEELLNIHKSTDSKPGLKVLDAKPERHRAPDGIVRVDAADEKVYSAGSRRLRDDVRLFERCTSRLVPSVSK